MEGMTAEPGVTETGGAERGREGGKALERTSVVYSFCSFNFNDSFL